jgi:pyruvate-formate lyase
MGTRTLSLGWNRRLTKGEMAVTGTKPDEFRRLAQECRATAQTVSTEQARAEMLAMAEVCDRAAAQQTQGTDLSGATAQQNMTAFAKSWRRE